MLTFVRDYVSDIQFHVFVFVHILYYLFWHAYTTEEAVVAHSLLGISAHSGGYGLMLK